MGYFSSIYDEFGYLNERMDVSSSDYNHNRINGVLADYFKHDLHHRNQIDTEYSRGKAIKYTLSYIDMRYDIFISS
jgi:hypothetical protein